MAFALSNRKIAAPNYLKGNENPVQQELNGVVIRLSVNDARFEEGNMPHVADDDVVAHFNLQEALFCRFYGCRGDYDVID